MDAESSDAVQRRQIYDSGNKANNVDDVNENDRSRKQTTLNKIAGCSSIPLRRNASNAGSGHQNLDSLKTAYGRLKAVTMPNTRLPDLHQSIVPNKSVRGGNATSLHCDLEATTFSLESALEATKIIGSDVNNTGNLTGAGQVCSTHRTLSGANIGKKFLISRILI